MNPTDPTQSQAVDPLAPVGVPGATPAPVVDPTAQTPSPVAPVEPAPVAETPAPVAETPIVSDEPKVEETPGNTTPPAA